MLSAAHAWTTHGSRRVLRDLLKEGLQADLGGTFIPKYSDSQVVAFSLEVQGPGACWVLSEVLSSSHVLL